MFVFTATAWFPDGAIKFQSCIHWLWFLTVLIVPITLMDRIKSLITENNLWYQEDSMLSYDPYEHLVAATEDFSRGGAMRILAIVICMALFFSINEATASGPTIGVVKTVKGEAFIEREQKSTPAKTGDTLLEKDEIVTGRDGSMGVIMKDDSVLSIGANSRLQFTDFMFEPAEKKLSTVNRLKRGTLVYLSGLIAKIKPEAVRFETKTAVVGIRGTYLAISEQDDALKDFTEEQAAKLNAIIRKREEKKEEVK
jgi:hypothetical protein